MVQIGPNWSKLVEISLNLSKLVQTLHIFSFFVDGILAKDIGEELGLPIYLFEVPKWSFSMYIEGQPK